MMVIFRFSRTKKEENPNLFPPSIKFDYSPSTSTSTLCKHMMKKHEQQFLQACINFNWDIPQVQTDVNTDPVSSASVPGREPFSSEALLKHIVNFVVADDQVSLFFIYLLIHCLTDWIFQSISVVECPEFRLLLLLLREDLKEEDIPRRDKICSAIIKAWHALI